MKFKGAIIGLGNIALKGHVPAYLKYRDQLEIVAGVDICTPNHERFKKYFPEAVTYYDSQDLFASQELDFVDICTPPAYHAQIIRAAAGRKIHVLCEKPVVTDQAEMELVAQDLKNADIVFMPCHQYRYSPQWQTVWQLIDHGRIGKPWRFEVKIKRSRPNPGNPHWQPNWRTIKQESGGGIVLDHGSHQFYLAMQLLGLPLSVCARLETQNEQHKGVEDTAHITIEHEIGASQFDLSWNEAVRRTEQTIKGELGQIIIVEDAVELQADSDSQHIDFKAGLSADSAHADWHEVLLQNFIEQLGKGCFDPDPLKEAQCTLRCALLAYESARLGETLGF